MLLCESSTEEDSTVRVRTVNCAAVSNTHYLLYPYMAYLHPARNVAARLSMPVLALSAMLGVTYAGSLRGTRSTEGNDHGPWRAIGAIDPRISPSGNAIVCSYQGAIWRIP